MSAIHWRGVLLGGLFLAAQATTVAAQERELLTLEAALARAGIVDSADEPPENPRLIGPRAEADAARALVDQARLRPNPEIAFEAENIAGSGAFSGLQATEYTLSLSQRLELGGKQGARVRAAQAEARVATLSGALSVAQLGRSVRERYVEAGSTPPRETPGLYFPRTVGFRRILPDPECRESVPGRSRHPRPRVRHGRPEVVRPKVTRAASPEVRSRGTPKARP